MTLWEALAVTKVACEIGEKGLATVRMEPVLGAKRMQLTRLEVPFLEEEENLFSQRSAQVHLRVFSVCRRKMRELHWLVIIKWMSKLSRQVGK
jgi:hypothetical protein